MPGTALRSLTITFDSHSNPLKCSALCRRANWVTGRWENIAQHGLRSSDSGPVSSIHSLKSRTPHKVIVNIKSNGPDACENTLIKDTYPRVHHVLLLPLSQDFICKTCTVAAALEDMGMCVHEVEEIWLALETFAFEFFQQRSVPALAWEVEGPTFAQIHWVGFWASVREHLASEALSASAQVVGSRTGAYWLKQTSFV